ncbi:MAG: hypothetical protein ACK4R6_11190 [Spirosomataceae bacterium]
MHLFLEQQKFSIAFLFFALFSFTVFAQRDRIVTQAGEEIRCKIAEETPARFSYFYINPTGQVAKNQIFKSLVTQFDYNYYPENISEDKVFRDSKSKTETVSRFATPPSVQEKPSKATPQSKSVSRPSVTESTPEINSPAPARSKNVSDYYFSGTTFGLRGGLTNYMASSSPVAANSELFYDRLYRAYHGSADLTYFFNKGIGIGIKASQLRSTSEGDGIEFFNGLLQEQSTGFVQINRIVTSIAPMISLRYVLDPKTFVYLNGAAGMFQLNESGVFLTDVFKAKGMNLGISGTLGFDFLLGKNLKKSGIALNIEAGYSSNNQPLIDYGQGAKTLANPLDLSHLSLSMGVKWMKIPTARKKRVRS